MIDVRSGGPLALNGNAGMVKKQKKKQAKREAKMMLQLAQSQKDVRKAQRKVRSAQDQLASSRERLRRLEEQMAGLQVASLSTGRQESDTNSLRQDSSLFAAPNPPATDASDDRTTTSPAKEDDTVTIQQQEKEATIPEYGLYAYGVVEQRLQLPDMLGIDQKNRVYPVTERGIAVIVSKIDISQFQEQVKALFAELTQGEGAMPVGAGELLQAHEAVIEALMQDGSILPLKFGTILKDENAALIMLQEHEGEFKDLLAKLGGKVECGLKVYADRQALMQHMMRDEPELAAQEERREQLSKGAAYLLRRKNEEELKDQVAARLSQICKVIFHTLGKDSAEAKLNDVLPHKMTGKKKEMVLNAAYLVEKEKVPQMDQEVKSLTEEYAGMGIELESSGPWPPYNFTRTGNEQ